jgi:ferredoxin
LLFRRARQKLPGTGIGTRAVGGDVTDTGIGTDLHGAYMAAIEERTIGEYLVQIDRLLCVGFGDCITEAPDTFEFDDEGIAVFREDTGDVSLPALLKACEACPVDALVVLDDTGRQIVP